MVKNYHFRWEQNNVWVENVRSFAPKNFVIKWAVLSLFWRNMRTNVLSFASLCHTNVWWMNFVPCQYVPANNFIESILNAFTHIAYREQTRIQNRPPYIYLCWAMAIRCLPSNEIRSIIKPSWIFWIFSHSSKIFSSYSPDYIFKIHTQHTISLRCKDQKRRHTMARNDTLSTSKLTIFIYTLSRLIHTFELRTSYCLSIQLSIFTILYQVLILPLSITIATQKNGIESFIKMFEYIRSICLLSNHLEWIRVSITYKLK